jgi:enoyl-CoA hydratase/carnithine racemase
MTNPGVPLVLRSDRGKVATLTLNRPEARNALSRAVMLALIREIEIVAADPDAIKVVILAANGPVFSSGHDLKELRAEAKATREIFDICSAMMLAMTRAPQPIIARVHAMATAAGCQLVATADLAVAADTATFATPGVNIGLFCSTPMVALSRNVGRKKAMEMLLTGRPISAAEAATMGLINMVSTPEALDKTVDDLADVIASKSGRVLAIGKRAFYEQIELGLADSYTYASAVMAKNMLEPDASEGLDAFLGKRKPVWADG